MGTMGVLWIASIVSWIFVAVGTACPPSFVLNLSEGHEAIEHTFGRLGRDSVENCNTLVEVTGSDCYSGMKVEVEVGTRSGGNLEALYQNLQHRRQKHGAVKEILEVSGQVLKTLHAVVGGFDFVIGDLNLQKTRDGVLHLDALRESLETAEDLLQKGLEVKQEQDFLEHLTAIMEGTNRAKVLLDLLTAEELQVTTDLREALGKTLGALEGLRDQVDEQGRFLNNNIQLAFLAMRREKYVASLIDDGTPE